MTSKANLLRSKAMMGNQNARRKPPTEKIELAPDGAGKAHPMSSQDSQPDHSNVPGNPHATIAVGLLHTSDQAPLIHAELAATQALVEATLALAHEQRTANLIALYSDSQGMTHELHHNAPINQTQYDQLARDILERLGLK